MEFREHMKLYQKNKARMCKSMGLNCKGCPIYCTYPSGCNVDNRIVENYESVAEWAAAHPEKTYRMDFKERFPNMDEEFITDACRCRIYGYPNRTDCDDDGCPKGMNTCSECWDVEMEVD